MGIVVANAGFGVFSQFRLISSEECQKVVRVNVLQVAYIMKIFAEQLVERYDRTGVKGGILVTSSFLAKDPIVCLHSASKAFDSYLAESLNYELRGKVDVLSYQAGETITKMLGRFEQDINTITAERAA